MSSALDNFIAKLSVASVANHLELFSRFKRGVQIRGVQSAVCSCGVRPRKHAGQAIDSHTSERISTVECRPAASTGFGAQRGQSRTLGATSRAVLISMMRDALNGRFDVVLAEALDRFPARIRTRISARDRSSRSAPVRGPAADHRLARAVAHERELSGRRPPIG